ncbi:unnamed protein product [Peronospora belbahrii]|uniref:Uncharacterized protein n=1 Tax=Peronospora belbahrii TaxID=622444 RepID=A0AAU9LCM8_9STRA|nr:unnamed protein product [Peronospora belbahrii]
MPKSAHSDEGPTVDDHAAMKKQWQTNLEIDLLKNAWIRKDREQYGARPSNASLLQAHMYICYLSMRKVGVAIT